MKKPLLILITVLITGCITFIGTRYLYSIQSRIVTGTDQLASYETMLDGYIPPNGYVPDEKAAAFIAEGVIGSRFPDTQNKAFSYIVSFDSKEDVWIVIMRPVVPVSGDYFVIINKTDGRVIRAWGTKF